MQWRSEADLPPHALLLTSLYDAVVTQIKRQIIKLGSIVVLQTAGRSATYNPHLHAIKTDDVLRADGTWQRLGLPPV